MKLAISLIRWSTAEQADGMSEKRQIEKSEAWATRNGYALDQSRAIRAGGQSAYLKTPKALAQFLMRVEARLVPVGSALLIESCDRLSRQQIDKSLEIVRTILRAEIDIVILSPEYHLTKNSLNDATAQTLLIWFFQRSHEESQTRSDRTKRNWKEKRERIAAGRIVTPLAPFWLDVWQDGQIVSGNGRGWGVWCVERRAGG